MKKLFIIDGNSLANRAFYAIPMLADSDGVYSNAVFGFVNCVIKLIVSHSPDYIVVAFDHARKTFRNDIYDGYKATRKPMPSELAMQMPILKDVLTSMGIKCIEKDGIEADDIIGTIAKHSGCLNYIITGDRDSLQLIDENTCVWLTQKGISDIKEVTLQNIKELYGVNPSGIIDFKALAGDKSDNIPGVPGIGEKTALNLLEQYGDIDGIYENIPNLSASTANKLINGKSSCVLSYKLATIKTDCDLQFDAKSFVYDFPFGKKTREYFIKYSFKILLKKDFIFRPETLINGNIEKIRDNKRLAEIIDKFDSDYLCLDFREKLCFATKNGAYEICEEITLFDCDPVDVKGFLYSIKQLLLNDNILKIVFDLKAHMHIFNTDNIKNVFDINMAQYLISGGNKVEKKIEINEFYDIFLSQKKTLNDKDMDNLYYDIEMPLQRVLYNMELGGFKLDLNALTELKKSYGNEMLNLENDILSYSNNKSINIKSAKQLSEFLFEDLKLPDTKNKKHSTSVDFLNELVDVHPVIPMILRYRKVQKMYSTYIEPYFELMDQNSMIKTIFNQTQTSTGRLSSSEPNLQNIPVRDEEGKTIRRIFISRFEGGNIMSADYNQIELRLLANLSGDENLISDYNKGTDIHRLTASQMFNKPIDKIDEFERRSAKAVNFGVIYGISSFGLSKNLDILPKDAEKFIELYFKKYPKTKQYLDGQIKFAKLNGYVKTVYNRIRFIPEIESKNGTIRMFGERVAMNMPLQGTASDIIKIAMQKVYNKLESEKLKSKLILQIHDELIVDVYPGEENKVKEILVNEMQNSFEGKVPLIVSANFGKTWYDCK